jgi:hypothetical protein
MAARILRDKIYLVDHYTNTIPGAFHHARWMAKAIYCLKVYLFRYEFKLTKIEEKGLCDISIFLVLVYIEAWFDATLASTAPYNDLNFIKKLYNYKTIDDSISRVSFNKFKNHLWYLSPESVGLAFFDINISVETKKKMVKNLKLEKESPGMCKRVQVNDQFIAYFMKYEIEHFISSETNEFFNRFNFDISFLQKDPSTWPLDESYQNAFDIVKKLNVVNDAAERGIKLIEDYNNLLTKNEEQKQLVLQVVSDYRSHYPDCKKNNLKNPL